MKRFLLIPAALLLVILARAQSGYQIAVSLQPIKNQYIYLGFYYGSKKALADSVMLDDNGKGSFRGSEALPGGIYFLVSPRKQILFDFLIDSDQHFSITADTTAIPASIQFAGSPDNDLFRSYSNFVNRFGSQVEKIKSLQASSASDPHLRDSLNRDLKKMDGQLLHFRDSMIRKNPESLLAVLFKAMREPAVPPASQQPGGKYDSNYVYRYYKSHYWDGVSFSDGRLVRTPFFETKLDRYYKDLVPPDPDSISRELDNMILYARSNKEMYQYLLVHFVQKYINPEYMGQDAVFVHLFEKYINTNQATFFTREYRDFMDKRAYSIMANLIGHQAANLEMVDSLNQPASLYDVKSDFVVVCFWDPTCSHCKDIVPRVDSIYQAKWKKQGVKMYGVMVDGGKQNWEKFIVDHNLKDWVHVYQLPSVADADEAAGRPGYRQLYDVYQTPLLYLLDKDKRIIAKKLDYQQMDQVIDLKLNQRATTQ